MIKKSVLAIALLLLVTAGVAQASDLWFHVTVKENTEDANVSINLPLAFVEKALAMIPVEATETGSIVLGDEQVSAAELRDLWNSVQQVRDTNFVTIQKGDDVLRFSKAGRYLTVKGTAPDSEGTTIDVKIPASVVDALLSNGDNSLNLAAALEALAAEGEGELAAINSNDAKVRVWIDSFPEVR
jgi:hypothetical protein